MGRLVATDATALLEYHADYKGNGLYDDPPTDHSFRVGVLDVGRRFPPFPHRDPMFSIGWPRARRT